MQCPYCNKRVSDVPDHLIKSIACKKKHANLLRDSILVVVGAGKSESRVLDITRAITNSAIQQVDKGEIINE